MARIEQDWHSASSTKAVYRCLAAQGGRSWCVGGCVRDALMGVSVSDVDFATDLTPQNVIHAAETVGLRAIPTGIEHGTITVLAEDDAFEITTLRKDLETDGRRAVVAYSTHLEDDAARRDFTINALYADETGEVLDPLGSGLDDIKSRYVRFIGVAQDRIREDYLRSLRYFRFFATHGDQDKGFDPEALAAISGNLDGIESLSRERIGHEVMRLLSAGNPAFAVAGMQSSGVLARVVPGAETRFLAPLVHVEEFLSLPPEPVRRLAALGGDGPADRLRLSRVDKRRLETLKHSATQAWSEEELGYRLGVAAGLDVIALRSTFFERMPAIDSFDRVTFGSQRTLPVTAADLMPEISGQDLGKALRHLEKLWIASGFEMNKDALLSSL